jgi:hypothetical protein
MARALEPVAESEILRRHPSLTFQDAGFQWSIVRDGDRSVMTVTGKGETITAPLLWAFGRGQAGQTYIFERDGSFYESRVSFYNALGGLDVTMGAQQNAPKNIDNAAGRRMDNIGARDCFGCHSTGAVSGGRLHLESIVPGVGCESCHGLAGQHIAAVRAGNPAAAKMAKLSGRGAEETAAASYDAKCSACHSAAQHTKTCRVAKDQCVTCHMPKIELPGAHARFTDHQIRIVRAGEAYPN